MSELLHISVMEATWFRQDQKYADDARYRSAQGPVDDSLARRSGDRQLLTQRALPRISDQKGQFKGRTRDDREARDGLRRRRLSLVSTYDKSGRTADDVTMAALPGTAESTLFQAEPELDDSSLNRGRITENYANKRWQEAVGTRAKPGQLVNLRI